MSDKNVIRCKYSLLDEGRKYTGNHRKYIMENAREACYAPASREKIALREAFGYYGHGRRILSGRVDIEEVGVVTLPDGTQAMVSHIPSNITTQFDIETDGIVTHTQRILDTETGKIVHSLHNSKVGGFSWAFHGHTARDKTAHLAGFAGFDYVLQPGFAHNRGYVLESANADLEQAILESVSSALGADVSDARVESLVAGWKHDASAHRIQELENVIFESGAMHAELLEKGKTFERDIATAYKEKSEALAALEDERSTFKGILEGLQENLPIFIPQGIMHEIMNGDFARARVIFESAELMDFSQYPLRSQRSAGKITISREQEPVTQEWGSAGYGFGIEL